MASWVDARLAAAGIRRRSEVARIWLRPRAALLSVETDRGRMWAKAVPPVFAHEIALTELLADIDPGIVPPVVAADRSLGRIITEHVEGPLLSGLDDPAVWTATLSRLAEIQRVLASEPAALREAGAVTAPLARLAENLPVILADDDLLLVDRPDGLTRREAAELRRPDPGPGARLPVARCQRDPRQPRPRGSRGRRGHHRCDGAGLPRLVRRLGHPSLPVGGVAPVRRRRHAVPARTGSRRRISARGCRPGWA